VVCYYVGMSRPLNNLVIRYKVKGKRKDDKIENAIKLAMRGLGYRAWSSNYSSITGYIDVAFYKLDKA